MNTKDEALKLALEALEVATTPLAKDRQEVLRAITAIREALADHIGDANKMVEQSTCKQALQVEQPAQQQEPFCYHDGRDIVGKEYADHSDVFPLYTAPKPRQWVGLTQQDIDIAFDDTQEGGGFDDFARAIEAKLREKNAQPSKPLTDEQQISESLRRHGLTLVKTAAGYDVLKLEQITAHGIKGEA